MAVTKLGGIDFAATTDQSIIQTTSGSGGTFNITFVNRGVTAQTIRLGVGISANTFIAGYYLLYDEPIAAKESVSFTGIVLRHNDYLIGWVSATSINAIVYGWEK